MRILIAEDEPAFSRFLEQGLAAEHFTTELAPDGEQALLLASGAVYDAIILDQNLPKLDGLAVLKRLRTHRVQTPILLIAENNPNGRVDFHAGATDYLIKPFALEALLERVHALVQSPNRREEVIQVADLSLDRARQRASRSGRPISLTRREYALLDYLMRNAGRPVTRAMIMEQVWRTDYQGLTNIVDVYINYLRGKIDKGASKKLIHTARGVGYVLMDPENQKAA